MKRAIAALTALFLILALPVAAQGVATSTSDAEVIKLTWQGLAALISTVLAVGLGSGIGGAVLIIKQARQSEELKYAMERLYMSAPPTTQEHIRQIVQLLAEGGKLADEVTDGVIEAQAQDG